MAAVLRKRPAEAGARELPTHLAIIMDGNGRWAKQRLLPRRLGHRAGAENLKRVTAACARAGVRYLTVYAFSTENWRRPGDEVENLMALFIEFLERYDTELAEQDIRLRFQGDLAALPERVRTAMLESTERSAGRRGMHLVLAFNYGGRDEILYAARKLARRVREGELDPEHIDGDLFRQALYLPDVPDPDLIIRTSGEFRLSNFLLWESAYSELWVADVLWPDFSEDTLEQAFAAYAKRERRYGGI